MCFRLARSHVTGLSSTRPVYTHDISCGSRWDVQLGDTPLAVASRENWVPDDDYVSTQPSSSGGRYVLQDFYYAAGRTINMGGSGGGLEMKYHQNKYDGGAYFDTSEYGNRIPIVLAWSSTIPCPYLDSRAPNPLEEPSWTLGSNGDNGCWNAWSAGSWYDNYVRVSNGLEGTDDSKVIVSHEQCGPLGTCDTWNMTMDDNCPYGFWPVAVPTWQWHWNRFTGAPGVSACM